MKRIFSYAFFLSLLCACAHVEETITTCDVLPMTKSAELKSTRFAFDGDVALSITAGDEDTRILTGFITESPLKVAQEGKKSLHLEVAPIEGITSPEGYRIEYGGQFESEQAASNTLLLTSLMSIIIIYLLLYMEFKSASESAVILLNLPLALIGGIFALLLTSGEMSIPAIIGLISLFGIATRNGMLLISNYNRLRTQGMNLYESVVEGSLDRLNPILMTALSSALAMIPLAINGKGHPRWPLDLHLPQRLHHTDCLPDDEQKESERHLSVRKHSCFL